MKSNLSINNELLKTKSLKEFREIIINNNIKDTKSLSNNVLLHFNKLGNKQDCRTHSDPRKIKGK